MQKKITALFLVLGMAITLFDGNTKVQAEQQIDLVDIEENTECEIPEENEEQNVPVERLDYVYDNGLIHDGRFENYEKIYGIDVSKYQGSIDWAKVKKAGVEYAILRVGYRAYGTGKLYVDPRFAEYMEGAHKEGIKLGAYFYTQAITAAEAKEEANFVIKQLAAYPGYLTYPVFYDIEDIDKNRLGSAKLTNAQTTSFCKKFCDTIIDAGYAAGVYANYHEFNSRLNKEELSEYSNWLARYAKAPTLSGTATGQFYDGVYDMWQYSSTGKVNGISGNVDMDVFYRKPKLDKPTEFKQTKITDTSIALSWKPTAYTDGYQIVRMDKDGKKIETLTTAVPEYRMENLTNGVNEKFKVRSYYINSDGTYTYGSYTSVLNVCTIPAKVGEIGQKDCDSTSATIEWDSVSGASGYRIRIYDETAQEYTTLGSTTKNTYEITGLQPRESLQISVQAYVKINGSTKKYGSTSDLYRISAGLEPVTGVEASNIKSDAITLTWNSQEEISGYEVNCYDVNEQLISTEQIKETVYMKQELDAAQGYQFEVRSYLEREDGNKVYGDYSARYTIKTLPQKVKGVKAEKIEDTSLVLKWDKVEGADGYRIYVYDPSKNKSKFLKTVENNSYEITKLSAASVYHYKVAAYVECDTTKYRGSASDAFEVVTKPSQVTGMKVTRTTKNSIDFSWEKQNNVHGYQVYLYDKGTKKSKLLKTTSKNSYKMKDLKSATKYYVKVRAYYKWNDTTISGKTSSLLTVKTK